MNTEALTSKSCTPCRGGIPPLSADQVKKYHRDTPEWTILDEDRRIERTFRFNDFAEAFAFVKSVSELAKLKAIIHRSALGGGTRQSRCKPRK
jgi:4a-hydroxytetrahydrobiopterin dehydratase